MSFGNFIRTKRLEKGYTLRGFSVKVGISPTFTSRMERDEIEPPSEDKINAIAEVLDIDGEELVFMAKRIPKEVRQLVINKPSLVPLLRIANTKSPQDLDKLIEYALNKKSQNS
jgi:transcriptional regulator with XRE-family HTH domain